MREIQKEKLPNTVTPTEETPNSNDKPSEAADKPQTITSTEPSDPHSLPLQEEPSPAEPTAQADTVQAADNSQPTEQSEPSQQSSTDS